MLIRLKKTRDGVVLSCVRADGSVAVQRTGHAGFFALHDLMHYAVETTLGLRRAFLGLMAEGWSFETFGDRDDPRYRSMPADAVVAEHLVDIISRGLRERAWADPDLLGVWCDDVNAELAGELAHTGLAPLRVDPDALAATCRAFHSLAERWAAVPIGGHLELPYPPDTPPPR